jgi:hypothetical protein
MKTQVSEFRASIPICPDQKSPLMRAIGFSVRRLYLPKTSCPRRCLVFLQQGGNRPQHLTKFPLTGWQILYSHFAFLLIIYSRNSPAMPSDFEEHAHDSPPESGVLEWIRRNFNMLLDLPDQAGALQQRNESGSRI